MNFLVHLFNIRDKLSIVELFLYMQRLVHLIDLNQLCVLRAGTYQQKHLRFY